ncbi:RNA polymerase sigma factor [Brucella sp. BE17]|uniref:RNA polymerase sigma factor n=1 Tax=Brucella sp. BE17 TaxID=3142977 RepID=UPI0031BB4ADC
MTTRNVQSEAYNDLMTIYLCHWRGLGHILKKRIGSHELAEDALQETWIRLQTSKTDIAVIRDKQAFILRVASNIATDLIRKEQRHSSRCISDEAVLAAVADAYPSPEAVIVDRDHLRHLVSVLAKLPVNPREALLFNRCDGLTHAEIAERLNVSVSTVAYYLAQALRHCRDHFQPF